MTAVPRDVPSTVRGVGAAPTDTGVCRHCGEALPSGVGAGFCCRGCEAAFGVIQGLGLGAFYDRRIAADDGRRLRPDDGTVVDLTGRVRTDGGIGHLDLLVDGLHCAACVWLVESVLAREPDVVTARVQLASGRLSLAWMGPPERANALVGAVAALGFRLVPFDPSCLRTASDRADTELMRALGVTAFASMNVMMLSVGVWMGWEMGPATRDLLHWMSALVAMPAIAWAGLPFYRPAFAAIRRGCVNMDVPISLGILLTTAMSLSETIRSGPYAYFDGAVSLLFFLLLGRFLDRRARGRARSTAAQLLALRATAATRVDADGVARPVPPEALATGDLVLVAAGERVPADGTVRQGRSDLDTALVTGESAPQVVEPGARVFAGMVNLSAPLRIAVTATGEGTLLAEIGRMMDAAERGRAGFVAIADRVAGWYAPVVHTVAAATFLGWWLGVGVGWQEALLYAVAALIVTCPCGLALAVPAVQVVATGRLLRRGILAKSPTALERLAHVDTVVFDKTGTLTMGRPVLVPDPNRDPSDLAAAAGLARASRHPLARALARACPAAPVRDDVVELPGLGLEAGDARLGSAVFCGVEGVDVATPHVWFVRPDRAPVRFVFEDPLRPDAVAVVAALRDHGIDVRLLSGDRAPVVAAAAAAAGIPRWTAETSPVGKVAALEALRAEGRRVMMVGDGLNDAPALAAAHVSMSPAEAADISQTAADVVFRGERLSSVPDTLGTARLADRVVKQNLAFALVYNVVAVPMAILGLVTPAIAAAVMSTSSIAVVLNALRTGRPLTGGTKWTS